MILQPWPPWTRCWPPPAPCGCGWISNFKRAPRYPARQIAYFDGYARTYERGPGIPVRMADGLSEHRANMQRVVEGVKALLEQP